MVDQLFLSPPFPSSFPVVDVCVCVCMYVGGHINLSLASWLGESVCLCVNGLWVGVNVRMIICVLCVFLCMLMCVWVCVCVFLCVCMLGVYQVSVPVLPQARRGDRWSWDPDEERKRQERWQQEQERMLQVHSIPQRVEAWRMSLQS